MEAAGVLSATFSLGILLHAASASFVSGIHGHFRSLLLVRRRVVLLSFLLSISLFAIAQFAGLLLLEDVPCQVAVIFSTTFDQLARVLGFAYVISVLGDETSRGEKRITWALLTIRALLGAAVVGFMRIDFIPVCYATPSLPVINYSLMALDAVILLYLILRTPTLFRLFQDLGGAAAKENEHRSRGYGVWLISLALTGWFLASIPHNIAVGSIFVRTVPLALALTLALSKLLRLVKWRWVANECDSAFQVIPKSCLRRLFKDRWSTTQNAKTGIDLPNWNNTFNESSKHLFPRKPKTKRP